MNCRVCNKYMMDDEQEAELAMEIWGSTASHEGRMSDLRDLNLCDRCMRRQIEREVERDFDMD